MEVSPNATHPSPASSDSSVTWPEPNEDSGTPALASGRRFSGWAPFCEPTPKNDDRRRRRERQAGRRHEGVVALLAALAVRQVACGELFQACGAGADGRGGHFGVVA